MSRTVTERSPSAVLPVFVLFLVLGIWTLTAKRFGLRELRKLSRTSPRFDLEPRVGRTFRSLPHVPFLSTSSEPLNSPSPAGTTRCRAINHLLYEPLLPRKKAGSRAIKITLYICLDLTQKPAQQPKPPKKLINPLTAPLPTGYPAAFRSRET